jgi:CarD family transcriptional regulator
VPHELWGSPGADKRQEVAMVLKPGEAVVHPIHGAGFVKEVVERRWGGKEARYYRIELLCHPETSVMVPARAVKERGLRRAISQTGLKRLWRVLAADPEKLPGEHKKRYEVLKDKLDTGDALRIAEAVRDMAWRQQRKGSLNMGGQELYKQGIRFLAGEIAVVDRIDLGDAESQIRRRLAESLSVAAGA